MWKRILLPALILIVVGLPQPVRAFDLPAAASVPGITGHPQALSLDCESRSAADWAGFWGVSVDEITFFNQLPGSDNPETGFVGSVYDSPGNLPPRGYGVYTGPVAALLKEAYGLPADAKRNLTEYELKAELASGRPVIVWYIYGFRVTAAYSLAAADGSMYRAANFEHTGIVIAYDPETFTVVDAYTGWAQRVNRIQFLNSWAVLENMAILGSGIPMDPLVRAAAATAAPSMPPASYVVQPGDSIRGIADRLGVAWDKLASDNNLYPPYTIYPGQFLHVPGSGTPAPAQPEAAPPADAPLPPAETYIVQPGDTLAGIGRMYGIYWPDIANANGIAWPYTIQPGQVLILPAR
jgi:LysM repeat protein/uncharacterized protein YvpB